MDQWEKIFKGVQEITHSAADFGSGAQQTIAFARSQPILFDNPGYWDEFERLLSSLPADSLAGWARRGLESLHPAIGWDFLILDPGDCPEFFISTGLELVTPRRKPHSGS